MPDDPRVKRYNETFDALLKKYKGLSYQEAFANKKS